MMTNWCFWGMSRPKIYTKLTNGYIQYQINNVMFKDRKLSFKTNHLHWIWLLSTSCSQLYQTVTKSRVSNIIAFNRCYKSHETKFLNITVLEQLAN